MDLQRTFFIIDTPSKREAAAAAVASLDGQVLMCVEIKPYIKQRTVAQNRLYRKWLSIISEHSQRDEDALHEEIKGRLLGYHTVQLMDGSYIREPRSSAKKDVKAFSRFLEGVLALGEWLGLELPKKDDDYEYAMYGDTYDAKRARRHHR